MEPQNTSSIPADEGSPPAAVRIGYLLSQYPAISHTFFLNEVLGLRARGLHIETASINPPDRPAESLPEAEAQEARTTHYIKDGHSRRAFLRIAAIVFTHPSVALRGLAAVRSITGLTLRELGLWLLYLAEALLVGRWMKDNRLAHLHVHFGGPVASVGMLASIAWRIPYSLTIHGPEELLNTRSYRLAEKLAQASFVFCISDFCRSQLYAITPPADWPKFSVSRLGVDPLVLTPAARPVGFAARRDRVNIVCTGRMVPAKGHHILLQAIKMLLQRGLQVQLTLIGGGPDLTGLQRYVVVNDLAQHVVFTQALSHEATLAHLRRSDIFTLASFAEGIPVALMEAMSLGLPVVSTHIAGIPELIRSGIDGILVPPANALALAAALEQLITDTSLRRNLGAAGRQRIINQYNLPLNQELLAHLFRLKTAASAAEEGGNAA